MAEKWKKYRLSKVCIINPGKKEVSDIHEETEVSFLPMTAVSAQGYIISKEIRKLRQVKKGYTYFHNQDVLIAKITPCFENGKRAIARDLKNNIGFGSTEFHVLRPLEKVISKWVFYAISKDDFKNIAKSQMTGTAGQKRVPKRVLEEYQIPVPEIGLQRKISEAIETQFTRLDASVKALKSVKRKLDLYRKSVLKSAFEGKLVDAKYHKALIVDMVKVVYGKGLPKRERKSCGTIPVYGSGGVVGFHDASLIECPSIIIARKGSIGNVFLTKKKSWPIDTVYYLKDISIDIEYLYYFLISQNFKNTSTAVPSLRREDLERICVIYPKEIDNQKQIVSEIESRFSVIDKVEKTIDNALIKAEKLRKSILKSAFEGNLVR
ncbi:restriction endonuclease subunit S [bacterium]|nr:restriction endonuclease subunit S [bacterium]